MTLDVGARSTRVAALWIVDGPAVQRPALSGTHIARIDVDGQTVLLRSFEDPRVVRSIAPSNGHGHRYSMEDRGSIVVDVPLPADRAVSDVRIRIADFGSVRSRPTDPTALAELFDSKIRGLRLVASIGMPELAVHPEWEAIATALGFPAVTTGGFEIYVDRAGRYRWRLRRPDGLIVADSGQGYRKRSACEADLLWIRSFGLQSPIRSLDLDLEE